MSTPRETPQTADARRTFGGRGYDSRFIGINLPLPVARTQAVRNDLVGADGERIAHYTHFSLAVRRSRRMAAFVAWKKVYAESQKDGPLVTKVESKMLGPTDYSPMK